MFARLARWFADDEAPEPTISAVWVVNVPPNTRAIGPNGERVTLSGGATQARYDNQMRVEVLAADGRFYRIAD